MENKARYTVVGLFVLLFTIATVVFILWLARYDVEDIRAKEYRIYSKDSIAGLTINSIVEYKGLDIGTVEDIHIDPNNLEHIEIVLKIINTQVIKTDSYAIVQSQGVTGNKHIEIEGGTQNAPVLLPTTHPYAIIPLKKSFLDKITHSAGNISTQIETILSKFEALLQQKNINNFEHILQNVNESSQHFNIMGEKINHLIDSSIVQTLNSINQMVKNMDTVVQKDVAHTIKKIDALSSNMNLLSSEVRTMINQDVKHLLTELKATARSSQGIDKVLQDLENSLEKIDKTIESFNSNGGDMIFKTRQTKYGPGEQQ